MNEQEEKRFKDYVKSVKGASVEGIDGMTDIRFKDLVEQSFAHNKAFIVRDESGPKAVLVPFDWYARLNPGQL
jgi:hypothetical protein